MYEIYDIGPKDDINIIGKKVLMLKKTGRSNYNSILKIRL